MALNYNGIEFEPINTMVHCYGPVKDPSGSDQLYTEAKLTCRTLLNLQYSPSISADVAAGGVSATLTRIRHYLTQPRRPLYYDVVSPAGSRNSAAAIFNITDGRDDAGGPWPDDKSFDIQYTTTGGFEVSWSCTVRIRDCGASRPDGNNPSSLRWEDSISWDETWKATFHRAGTLIISSRQQRTIDWFRRNKLALPVPSGFHRKKAHYLCSRDGLRCDFTFTDEQITFAPPYPAVKMKIVQSETAPTITGMKKGNVSVHMLGIQNANIRDLASLALVVMKARVWAANPINLEGKVPGMMNIETQETSDGAPIAVASCQYKVQPGAGRDVGTVSKRSWGSSIIGALPGVGTIVNVASAVNTISGVFAAPKTEQKKDPTGTSSFPWIGAGTTPKSVYNQTGYASWASPTGAVGGSPPDGVGMASAISLFAALLNDPCGNQVSTTPYAITELELGNSVNLTLPPGSNTPQAGQGGRPNTTTTELSAAASGLNANQYQSVSTITDTQGLTRWDGKPGVYDYWQCLSEYLDSPGVAVLPTSDPNGVNIQVQYQSHMITLIKRWAAKRTGAPPTLPSKTPVKVSLTGGVEIDTNWVYVGGSGPQVRELGIAPDGVSIVYEATGYYVYQCLDASLVTFDAEIPPTLDPKQLKREAVWATNPSTQYLSPVQIVANILTPSGQPVNNTTNPLGSSSLPGTTPGTGSSFFPTTGVGAVIGASGIQSPSGLFTPIGSSIGTGASIGSQYIPPPAQIGFGASDPLAPVTPGSQDTFVGPPTDPFFSPPTVPPPLGTNQLPPQLPSVPAP